ncbi:MULTISPECIES: DUF2059 domain-containing protein [Chryseobacterium]|nr:MULTISPECIES: DUF2059 domain-containing protein [Chryseobacterium]
MKKIIFLCCMLVGVVFHSQSKQEKVRTLISLSGAFKLSKDVEKDVISRYKHKYTNVPDHVWTSLEPRINIDNLINDVINIYESKFTEKEIEELLVFYKSDLGKKLIQNSPAIMTEIQTATSNWGMNVNNLINNDLEAKGYLTSPPPPANPPAPMRSN